MPDRYLICGDQVVYRVHGYPQADFVTARVHCPTCDQTVLLTEFRRTVEPDGRTLHTHQLTW